MRCFFIVLMLLLPGMAAASENLIENLRTMSNTAINDGVIAQVGPDTHDDVYWKLQVIYNNTKHKFYNEKLSYESLYTAIINRSGFISITFITPNDLEDIAFVRFGLNGKVRDSIVAFDIKDIMPKTAYTLQWRVLNMTQGEIAWTDMRVVHCGDGYSLALGDEICSHTCENKSVVGGYVPADITKVYEPETCAYDESKLVCYDGYVRIDNTCEQMCTAGIRHLHVGDNKNILYARKISTPALCVKYNGSICYGHLTPGRGSGLNVNVDGAIYHLID